MPKLIMMRHGQSSWNLLNLFTGWVDVPLSSHGINEALRAGDKIKDLPIDVIYTSSLIRAQQSALLAMSVHASQKVPIIQHPNTEHKGLWSKFEEGAKSAQHIPMYAAWELNERMYGDLQGLDKQQTIDKYGEAQVKIWRRSFDSQPPNGESLKMTAERVIPYFEKNIFPKLVDGKNVFISAHGNSLRSIVMELSRLSPAEILNFEIPTGGLLIYEMKGDTLKKITQGF